MSEVRLKELSRDECLARLATARIGRIVYTEQALPAAQPVGFFLDDEEVIFRAGRGAELGAAVNHHVVAFQADDIDDATHAGWSVCGVGEAYEIADPARLTELAALAPPAWTSATTAPMVSIPLQRLSGRQLVLAEAS
jgi:nitroimidazol reductase NimA-like FMN-containing flavoprotein (pyridoxamine 5'-phosphate oxidase superfamily)